jgi:hypothetical protein
MLVRDCLGWMELLRYTGEYTGEGSRAGAYMEVERALKYRTVVADLPKMMGHLAQCQDLRAGALSGDVLDELDWQL